MKHQILKKQRIFIAIIMVVSFCISTSYAVAMPLVMDSTECIDSTQCDMCCVMKDSEASVVNHPASFLALLGTTPSSAPDSTPLPFYHPPG